MTKPRIKKGWITCISGHSKELILTGDELDPERALKLGLVNAVVEDEAALDLEVEKLLWGSQPRLMQSRSGRFKVQKMSSKIQI